jgi:hypothetical protein
LSIIREKKGGGGEYVLRNVVILLLLLLLKNMENVVFPINKEEEIWGAPVTNHQVKTKKKIK